jgi:hypothetical protein
MTLSIGLPAPAQTLRCDISSKVQCEPGGAACRRIDAKVWNVVDLGRRTLARCDQRGCDAYPANFVRSGAYTNILVPERSLLAKLSENGSFLEVATLTETVLVSFGTCRGN